MSKKHMRRYGGAVFTGSHLAEELLKRRYKEIIVDDLSTARPGYRIVR